MNSYVIAPSVTRTAMDPGLMRDFDGLNRRLRWKPLTTNLESCEEGGMLYFRITLRQHEGQYAGFPSGAPFMLTRDVDVKKRAFFLRHWVRHDPESDTSTGPIVPLQHMWIAVRNGVMLVRVDIDRPMTLTDTFKSVPFATWMFQVIQVDAVIEGLPGIRFAFAIERTVSPEERAIVAEQAPQGIVVAPRTQKAAARNVAASSTNTRPSPPQPNFRPALAATATGQIRPHALSASTGAESAAKTPVSHRYSAPSAATGIQPRPSHAIHNNSRPVGRGGPASRIFHSSFTRAPSTDSVGSQPGSAFAVAHPYLRLWEGRDMDNPYEPIFVTEDAQFDTRANKTWLTEEYAPHAQRYSYKRLRILPGADFPPYYFDGPDVHTGCDEPDFEIVVYPRKKHFPPAPTEAEDGDELRANGGGVPDAQTSIDVYAAAVKATSEFNQTLQKNRAELNRWLQDAQRVREEGGDESNDKEEDESDESD